MKKSFRKLSHGPKPTAKKAVTTILNQLNSSAKTAKSRRLKSTSDLSPSASPTTIGVPLALGGVAGRNIARTPPITAAIAPPRNM